MIVSAISNKGARTENLDGVAELRCEGFHAVLVVDAYGCKQVDVEAFLGAVRGISLSGISSSSELLGRIDIDFSIKMSVVCIVKSDGQVSISNLGDCRVYSEKGELLTHDHSNAWEDLLRRGIEVSRLAELVKRHPARRVLTRFLKFPQPVHTAQEMLIEMNGEKIFLLCTDGFWENLSGSMLMGLVSGVLSLNDLVEEFSGAPDNYTACMVRL